MVTVELCMGTSCHLMGTQELMDALDGLPAEQRQRPIDDDRAVVSGVAEPEDVPRRGGFNGRAERTRPITDDDLGRAGRTGATENDGKETERTLHG